MPSFSKNIRVQEYGELRFTFTHFHRGPTEKVFVVVTNRDSKVLQFDMQQVADSWMITNTDSVPGWILGLEMKLERVIRNH